MDDGEVAIRVLPELLLLSLRHGHHDPREVLDDLATCDLAAGEDAGFRTLEIIADRGSDFEAGVWEVDLYVASHVSTVPRSVRGHPSLTTASHRGNIYLMKSAFSASDRFWRNFLNPSSLLSRLVRKP